MKKILILILTCCILFEISGCGNTNNITDNANSTIEMETNKISITETNKVIEETKTIAKNDPKYLEQFENISINEEDYHMYMYGFEIYSQEVYFDENKDSVMNKVVCVCPIDNVWCSGNLYYEYTLKLQDNEWKVQDEMKRIQQSYDSVREEIITDNISGSYDIYETAAFTKENEYRVFAKIEEWLPKEDAYRGSAELLLCKLSNTITMDIQGSIGGQYVQVLADYYGYTSKYDFSNQRVTIHNVKGTILDWQQNVNGFLITNKDDTRYEIKLLLKESTREILLELIDNKSNRGDLYKFVKKE